MLDLVDRHITFGGETIPANVAATPKIIRARRKLTVTQIAGTNREVVDMEDAWECYDQPYKLFVGDGTLDSVQPLLDSVASVLYKKGWQILLDDYEPDIYRLAYYQGGFEVDNRYTRLGVFDISFRCRPERFLTSGSTAVTVASGSTLTNPTAFNALPLIKITGSGNGTITVAGVTMTITGMADYLYLDCEKQDCYRLPTENKNSLVSGNYPVLKSGANTVSYTGGITGCQITPKWMTI